MKILFHFVYLFIYSFVRNFCMDEWEVLVFPSDQNDAIYAEDQS